MKKTFTLFLLAFFMMASSVCAEDVVVNNIKLKLNVDAIHLTTKTNEGYVDATLNSDNIVVADGEVGYSVNYGNSGLRYWGGGSWYGIGNGTSPVSKDKVYAVGLLIEMKSGYKVGNLEDITLEVNGVPVNLADRTERDTNISQMKQMLNTNLRLFYVLPQANDDKLPVVINNVLTTPGLANVKKGGTKQFTATLTSSSSDPDDLRVTWSVAGNASTNTTISEAGLLTIGADETATELTVKATSVADNTKSCDATVKVCSYEVQAVSLSLNMDEMPWTTSNKTKEASAYFVDHISISENSLRIDMGNTYLLYMNGSWSSCNPIADENLTSDRIYGCRVNLEFNSSDYCWPEDLTTIVVKFNDEVLTLGTKVIKGLNVETGLVLVGSEPYNLSLRFDLPDPRTSSNVQGIENGNADTSNVYNLQGMKVERGYHGIVVKNGKKYVAQ